MAILDAEAVRALISALKNPQAIATAFALRTFAFRANYQVDYSADSRWVDAIAPSEAGEELLQRVGGHTIPKADFRLALFGLFWFQQPLIDVARSNLVLARTIIESEAKEFRLRWPATHGRVLYDRYNELFQELHDNLNANDVARLLKDTTQGVYQAGTIVSGPLGFIDSMCARAFFPRSSIGLWHCPMVDCRALHRVNLVPPTIPLVEAYRLLTQTAMELWVTRSKWESVLAAWPHSASETWRAFVGMPLFLGDCIVNGDRTQLLAAALSGAHGQALRQVIREKRPKDDQGDAAKVAAKLSSDEQLQLLLLLPDADIKLLLDTLVATRKIDVPTTEVRAVDENKAVRHYSSADLELSSLGVRASGKNPVLVFRHLLWNAYMQSNESSNLDWRLRKEPSVSTQFALMEYLRTAPPLAAIESLVLASPTITKFFATALDMTIDRITERTGKELAWKLGFDLPRDDRRQETLFRLLSVFSSTVTKIGRPLTDEDRESIRSAGVNAFVALEGFLEELIAYVVWILSSDHPKRTRFVYSRAEAIRLVPSVLGAEVSSGTEQLRWSIHGNTLGICVRYCQRLCEWLDSLQTADRGARNRPTTEIHERASNSVARFPFEHDQLWADASRDALATLAKNFGDCVGKLNKADVTYIRNGLEHYRHPERFPSTDRMVGCIEMLRSFVHQCEVERFTPKLYWIGSWHRDSFAQSIYELVDHKGETFSVCLPRTVTGLLSPYDLARHSPVLVAPGDLFGMPNADILFAIREQSVFTQYWSAYPAVKAADVSNISEDSNIAESRKMLITNNVGITQPFSNGATTSAL